MTWGNDTTTRRRRRRRHPDDQRRPAGWRSVTWLQLIAGALLLACGLCGTVVFGRVAADLASDLAVLVSAGLVLVLTVGGQAVAGWWLVTHRPAGHARTVLHHAAGHLPFLVTYAGLYVWFLVPAEFGRELPLSWLAWLVAIVAAHSTFALAWLHTGHRWPRRRLLGPLAAVVLTAVTAVPAGAVAWDRTYGFGLAGERTPGEAVAAVTALSCLAAGTGPFYHRRGDQAKAVCPTGEQFEDRYRVDGGHDPDLSLLLDGDQVPEPFARWWAHQQRFRSFTEFELSAEPADVAGDTATVRVHARLQLAPGRLPGDRWFTVSGTAEVWVFRLVTAPAGGWRVAGVGVPDPITVTDRGIYTGTGVQ